MNDSNQSITIGITAYNEGQYLQEAWDSVINQTRTDWVAIMILDGGSDEKTEAIFDKISHPSLTKIKLSNNNGPYYCRTLAIQKSTTDWYCHLDADDLLPKNMVKNIHIIIDKYPNIQYIIGRCLYFDNKNYHIKLHKGLLDSSLAYTLPFNGQSPIKCELFNQVGGFNNALYWGGADRDFWISVLESNEEGVCINKIVYERRIRKNSLGYKRSNKRHIVSQIIVNGHPEYFSDINRKKICLSVGFEQSAKFYKKIGKRKKAMKLAQIAIDYGSKKENLANIIYEGNMSVGRYILRRVGRFIR